MSRLQRVCTAILVLVMGLATVSCSSGISETTGPDNNLGRRTTGFTNPDDTPATCEVTPVNVFASGGGIPFELSCESMENAVLDMQQPVYNSAGCLVGLRGRVHFTDSGNRYRFVAEVNGCWQDGGRVSVCGGGSTRCLEAEFPRLTMIGQSVLPEAR